MQDEKKVEVRDESPFNFDEYFRDDLTEKEKTLIANVLKQLSKCSASGATRILDLAKEAIPYCTRLHSAYR